MHICRLSLEKIPARIYYRMCKRKRVSEREREQRINYHMNSKISYFIPFKNKCLVLATNAAILLHEIFDTISTAHFIFSRSLSFPTFLACQFLKQFLGKN